MFMRVCVRCGGRFFSPTKADFRCLKCDPNSSEQKDYKPPFLAASDIAPGVNPLGREVQT